MTISLALRWLITHTRLVPTVVRGEFEWDNDKAQQNLTKHGVSFQEAATAMLDPRSIDLVDELRPERLVTIGLSAGLRVLLVVSTENAERTRIISARKANAHERALYDEE